MKTGYMEYDTTTYGSVEISEWNTNANPTQSGWYLVTIENEVGQRYVAPLYCMEYPYGNFTWEMNKMIGKVIAVQPFPSPYED